MIPVAFPDAETLLIDELDAVLDVPVRLTVNSPRDAEFVIAQRIGGPKRDLVTDEPMFLIEAWAAMPTRAKAILEQARTHIASLTGRTVAGVPVYRITEASGPAFLPDPDSQQARYTYTVLVAFRGAAPTP